jgi:hypothetical protein
MFKLSRIIALAILVIVAGGVVFLANWDIPAPTAKVEKVMPNDRFPR